MPPHWLGQRTQAADHRVSERPARLVILVTLTAVNGLVDCSNTIIVELRLAIVDYAECLSDPPRLPENARSTVALCDAVTAIMGHYIGRIHGGLSHSIPACQRTCCPSQEFDPTPTAETEPDLGRRSALGMIKHHLASR